MSEDQKNKDQNKEDKNKKKEERIKDLDKNLNVLDSEIASIEANPNQENEPVAKRNMLLAQKELLIQILKLEQQGVVDDKDDDDDEKDKDKDQGDSSVELGQSDNKSGYIIRFKNAEEQNRFCQKLIDFNKSIGLPFDHHINGNRQKFVTYMPEGYEGRNPMTMSPEELEGLRQVLKELDFDKTTKKFSPKNLQSENNPAENKNESKNNELKNPSEKTWVQRMREREVESKRNSQPMPYR